jgi:hypothetical protein
MLNQLFRAGLVSVQVCFLERANGQEVPKQADRTPSRCHCTEISPKVSLSLGLKLLRCGGSACPEHHCLHGVFEVSLSHQANLFSRQSMERALHSRLLKFVELLLVSRFLYEPPTSLSLSPIYDTLLM